MEDRMKVAREKLRGPLDELLAWLLDEDVEDVRRVIGPLSQQAEEQR